MLCARRKVLLLLSAVSAQHNKSQDLPQEIQLGNPMFVGQDAHGQDFFHQRNRAMGADEAFPCRGWCALTRALTL